MHFSLKTAMMGLYHIHHGEHGMDNVNNYLASIDFNIFPCDLVAIKLE